MKIVHNLDKGNSRAPSGRKTSRTRAPTGTRAPRATGESPEPASEASRGGRPSLYEYDGPFITDLTYSNQYVRAFVKDSDGNPDPSQRVILCLSPKKAENGSIYHQKTVIWAGDIDVIGRVLAYTITPSRRLKAPEWQEYVRARAITNEPGARPTHALIAAADLNKQKQWALWLEKLGVSLSGQSHRVGEFIKILGLKHNRTLLIQAQGPVYLDDGSPEPGELLDRSLVFATRSRVFDTHGETRSIDTDLDHIPDKSDYYDLTPPEEISDDQTHDGLELFRLAFGECTPKYAAIPAATIGQLFSGWLAAIRIDFWSAIHLTGEKGSGKSYYCLRWDSVQARNSRKTRGTITDIKPVLNLGDTTGTRKGPKYTVTGFGGYTITCDDALKKGATETEIRNQSENVSNLIRSQEAGGAALAKVDRERNQVNASESPALHSSVKIPSEIPIAGDSTLDRMIYLPHITGSWESGTTFIRSIAEELSTAGSRELMHRAYSQFVAWAFQRIPTDVEKCWQQAIAETDTWGVPARTANRYAAVLAGIFMLERFAHEHDVTMTEEITRATIALKDCARAQSGSNVPVALTWARELRRAIASYRASFPGPPIPNERGDTAHDKPYTVPGAMIETGTSPDGAGKEYTRVMPWEGATLEDFGMETPGNVRTQTPIYGYTMPSYELRGSGGRPPSNPLLNRWHVAIKRERFEDLCRMLSKSADYGFDPATVMRSLRELNMGDITNITITSKSDRTKFWAIDVQLLRSLDDTDED